MNTMISHISYKPCTVYDNINNNKTYKILTEIYNNPCCRSALERRCPNCWRILKRAVDKGFVIRIGYIYFITEDGLDKIDEIKLKYGINIF